jgi:hypothetical protein
MSTSTVRGKQIVYSLAILGLFTAMVPYGMWLEAQKQKRDLGEATLGSVDTGSFMLKLAMIGGARGIAANVLWGRAVELQKLQEWDKLKSTVDLITKLQPHFLAIWTFQGWNLSYNVSVEWDDPADKYVWIKEGIKFLKEGVGKNPKSPDLTWDAAWTYYHKIGFSDEAIVLRREFYDDEDEPFKTDPDDKNVYDDNFLLARGWFSQAVDKAETINKDTETLGRIGTTIEAPIEYVDPVANRKGRPGDLAFRSMPSHASTRYAQGLEKRSIQGIEATFGDRARAAWGKASSEWNKFGDTIFESHNVLDIQGQLLKQPIRLNDVRDPSKLDALATDTAYWAREMKLPSVSLEDAARLTDNKKMWTSRWGDQMNLRYWTSRCEAEVEPNGVRARQLFYEATIAYMKANFREAVAKYQEGLDLWKKVLDNHVVYRDDEMNKKDTGQIVRRYVDALRQAGMEQPADMPFANLLAEAEADVTPDPFDELDILGPTGMGETKQR